MAAAGVIRSGHTTPGIFAGRGTNGASKSFAELRKPTPCFLGSTHRLGFADFACDRQSNLLLSRETLPSALGNGNGAVVRTKLVSCRAAAFGGNNGAPARRRTRPSEKELDQLFVADLRRFMDSKDLPPLDVPSPAELQDRPDLVKGVRARGEFQVARLLGQYAAAEQASSPPPQPAEDPAPPERTPFLDAPTSFQTQPFPPPANGGLASPHEAETNGPAKMPTSFLDQVEAEPQRAPASRGFKTARTGAKGNPLPLRDSQATTDAVERLRQLGSAPRSEAPAAPATAEVSPPRAAAPVTSPQRPMTPPPRPMTPPPQPATPPGPSLSERAARFLQTGKMDGVDAEASTSGVPAPPPNVLRADSASSVWSAAPESVSGESIAAQKAALLKAKLRQRAGNLPAAPAAPAAPALDSLQSHNEKLYREILSEQQQLQQMSQSERQVEDDFKAQTFQELARIKDVLTSRESEVASMAEALKEARAQLSLLRAKSAAELSQARQEVLELQTRLRSAEKALEGLKHVRVEYWGQAEVVQLAGSFNGWNDYFNMEPDLSTEIPPPEGGRGPMVFCCELRLYPGDYEVKFIVDGEWQVDLRREIINRGMNQNNVLRVE